ncbi:MAG: hypothetical protein KAJ73_01635 [Zetaproteobacteria bacterium]|nr:hypothetical protein [Zetaproteobacteria bacterium]
MSIRIIMVAFFIAIALMATVQNVSAGEPFAAKGTVQYENGTTCPYGWNLEMENLNRTLEGEPWTVTTKFTPPYFDYGKAGEYVAESDYIQVTITSLDGRYSGTNTMMWSDAYNGVNLIINISVYEQTLPTENFTKPLPAGWSLISLPLTPTDNSVSAVLSGVSDVVYRYNATSNQFECPSTVDPGIGYFVHVTTPCTWEYEGTPVTSTSSGLKSGLNMIGVPNCTISVSDAMGSADYRYAARWNAADQKFEVYNPSAPVAFHGFTMMAAGEGYFISAKSDDSAFAISCPG